MSDKIDKAILVEALKKPFAQSAIKTRKGANNMDLAYVAGDTVLRRIMAAAEDEFDIRFSFPPFFTTMTKSYKVQGKPQTKEVSVFIVGVELTIPMLGTRCGIGVQEVQGGGEDLLKGAKTDAIKNAAKEFGVALDLYGEDIEGKNNPDIF